ncbi:MAG: aminotransferase class I/II-fold pyridoxal phosphate-dependent enzyme [Clostridia bacterium]|nr:aminotransferase class I/II-fold pyridoxal phosphate-dependent enzyme [Clostridia bacterium]
MDRKRIYLSSPTLNGREIEYVNEAFDTNWVAPLGPNVNEFEKEFAAYVNTPYAAALSAGTAAIHLALKLLGIKRDDIVLCSSLTFSATANPIAYEGAKAVFIDSERETWNMSPKALEEGLKKYPQAKAVIVVNLYGTPAKLKEITALCEQYHVPLIEDAAESLGALYEGKQTGTFGKLGIFSFNGNKIITTSGGGMLVGTDEALIQKARFLATQAREPARHYEHKEIGYNYRMSNVVAGIGRGQLKTLDEYIERKKKIYDCYRESFLEIEEIQMNPFLPESNPNFWLSCMTIRKDSKVKPLDVILALETLNIETRPIWKPLHLQPVFAENDFIQNEDDVAKDIFERGLCLPSDIKNTDEDMELIIQTVKGLFK